MKSNAYDLAMLIHIADTDRSNMAWWVTDMVDARRLPSLLSTLIEIRIDDIGTNHEKFNEALDTIIDIVLAVITDIVAEARGGLHEELF